MNIIKLFVELAVFVFAAWLVLDYVTPIVLDKKPFYIIRTIFSKKEKQQAQAKANPAKKTRRAARKSASEK